MKQKVSLTCALLHNPEFLILDEPFNALDVFATSVLSDILKKWSKGILFTSHIPETVYNLADRVIVLKNGYIHHDVKISSFKNINEFENWVKGHISIKIELLVLTETLKMEQISKHLNYLFSKFVRGRVVFLIDTVILIIFYLL